MNKTMSETFICSYAFFIPITSTGSLESCNPAVSQIIAGMPFRLIVSSITSLVVPGTEVTIALSLLAILFIRLDFPTFGFPATTSLMPSLKTWPFL